MPAAACPSMVEAGASMTGCLLYGPFRECLVGHTMKTKPTPKNKQDKRTDTRMRRFMRSIKERFFLRFHMSLILLGTALSGLIASKLLLIAGMENIIIRYPLTVGCSYLSFFVFVKLWLAYLSARRAFQASDVVGDTAPDLPSLSGGGSGSGSGPSLPSFRGGGGSGGGGGASGSFEGPAANAQAFVPPSSGTADTVSSAGKSAGNALSGIFDIDDEGIILIAIAVLLAAIFGSAIYLIYIAPHILSEAAFNFLLGSSLIKSYRRMDHEDWMGSVFKDTYKPFLIVLIVSLGAAWVIHHYAPEITRISDIFAR